MAETKEGPCESLKRGSLFIYLFIFIFYFLFFIFYFLFFIFYFLFFIFYFLFFIFYFLFFIFYFLFFIFYFLFFIFYFLFFIFYFLFFIFYFLFFILLLFPPSYLISLFFLFRPCPKEDLDFIPLEVLPTPEMLSWKMSHFFFSFSFSFYLLSSFSLPLLQFFEVDPTKAPPLPPTPAPLPPTDNNDPKAAPFSRSTSEFSTTLGGRGGGTGSAVQRTSSSPQSALGPPAPALPPLPPTFSGMLFVIVFFNNVILFIFCLSPSLLLRITNHGTFLSLFQTPPPSNPRPTPPPTPPPTLFQ